MVLSLDVAFENDGLFYAGEVFACTLTLTHNSPGSLGPAAVPATAGGGDGKRGLVLVNGLPVAHRKSMDLNWNALPPSSGSQESSTLAPVDASGPVASLRGILGATFSYLTGSSGTPEEAELEARPGSTSLNGKYYAPSRVLPEIGRRRKSHLTFTSQQPALVSSRRTSNAISPGIVPAQTKSSSPLLSEPVLVSQKRLGSVSELAVSTTKLHSETVASPDFGQEDPFSLPVMGLNAVPGGESNETPQKIQLEQQLTTLSLESGPDLPTPLSLAAPSTASSQPGHHIDPIGMDHKRHHLRDSATGRPPIPFSPAHNNATNHAASASSRPRASSVARSDMASSIGTSELLPTDHSFPHRSSKETLTHTEDIAWAFAQMTGHFAVEPSYMKTELLETLQSKVAYRVEGGGKGSVIGGGSLGLMNGTMSRPGSPADLKKGVFICFCVFWIVLCLKNTLCKETTKANPIFSTPPSILIADLSLPPGESKTGNASYTYIQQETNDVKCLVKYELILPSVLPPSYGGKVLRISYKLVVGVQKTDMTQKSFVVKIPFRLFNRTNGVFYSFDLMKLKEKNGL